MQNPFEIIASRLSSIEELLLDIKHGSVTPAPPPPIDGKLYLSAKEAAEFMGIKLQTLYQNIDRIPHIKKHGKLLFTRDCKMMQKGFIVTFGESRGFPSE